MVRTLTNSCFSKTFSWQGHFKQQKVQVKTLKFNNHWNASHTARNTTETPISLLFYLPRICILYSQPCDLHTFNSCQSQADGNTFYKFKSKATSQLNLFYWTVVLIPLHKQNIIENTPLWSCILHFTLKNAGPNMKPLICCNGLSHSSVLVHKRRAQVQDLLKNMTDCLLPQAFFFFYSLEQPCLTRITPDIASGFLSSITKHVFHCKCSSLLLISNVWGGRNKEIGISPALPQKIII